MNIRKNSGPTTAEAFRAAPPALRAPDEGVARAVWNLVKPRLADLGGQRPREIGNVASSVLKRVAPAERADVELVAMQALTVAVDTFVVAAREQQALFVNDVFAALATRWSRTFRRTPGRSLWSGEKKAETLIDARREMLEAGVDLDRIWTAVCDGIADLYKVRLIGGARHARGRRVELVEGEVLDSYEQIVSACRRPSLGRNRILLADASMPPLKIARWTVAERDPDVMTIGEPTKEVIEILQSTRLYLNAAEVAKDVDRLRALVCAHEYPKRKTDWWSTWTGKDRNTPEYKKDRKAFFAHFKELRDEYNFVAPVRAVLRGVATELADNPGESRAIGDVGQRAHRVPPLLRNDFKTLMAGAIDELAKAGKIEIAKKSDVRRLLRRGAR